MRAFGFYFGIVMLLAFIVAGYWSLVLTVNWLEDKVRKEYGDGTEL